MDNFLTFISWVNLTSMKRCLRLSIWKNPSLCDSFYHVPTTTAKWNVLLLRDHFSTTIVITSNDGKYILQLKHPWFHRIGEWSAIQYRPTRRVSHSDEEFYDLKRGDGSNPAFSRFSVTSKRNNFVNIKDNFTIDPKCRWLGYLKHFLLLNNLCQN